ncbi:MAG: hypothetical protein M3Q48_00615 [Actinomycetota bacterium]|nr:hypothetical protein [Actinomycetota bacterium]
MLIFILVVSVILGVVVYAAFATGLLSGSSAPMGHKGVPRLRDLPPGCLITLIVAGTIWFVVWGIVLILALRLLRTPLGS